MAAKVHGGVKAAGLATTATAHGGLHVAERAPGCSKVRVVPKQPSYAHQHLALLRCGLGQSPGRKLTCTTAWLTQGGFMVGTHGRRAIVVMTVAKQNDHACANPRQGLSAQRKVGVRGHGHSKRPVSLARDLSAMPRRCCMRARPWLRASAAVAACEQGRGCVRARPWLRASTAVA
eukprot:178867-Chlamydomonas_euryale.AAC.1